MWTSALVILPRGSAMTPKNAIDTAKQWAADIFAEEKIRNLRLEEVRFDEIKDHWLITIGFARPEPPLPENPLSPSPIQSLLAPRWRNSFKVVRISDRDGRVLGVENRESEFADG